MPVRLILVDDHKILRDGLRLRLQQEPDFSVVGEAASAHEAYACAEKTSPDLVIIDIDLPDESGIVATQRLRASQPAIKILVLTGLTDPKVAQDVLLAGASGFLRKEEASEELVRAIRTVISGKNYLSPDAATALTAALKELPLRTAEPVLTERELDFLKGLAEGKSYKEIAEEMELSVKSVEAYRARLVKKIGCSTRAELVRYAVRKGFAAP